jgi:hypothetical protein
VTHARPSHLSQPRRVEHGRQQRAQQARHAEEQQARRLQAQAQRNRVRRANGQEDRARDIEARRSEEARRKRLKARYAQRVLRCEGGLIQPVDVGGLGPGEPREPFRDWIRFRGKACSRCGAWLFDGESYNICCKKGNVQLPRFPEPPPVLKALLFGDSVDARVFRKNTRVMNQALSLASLTTRHVRPAWAGAYNPNVVISGRSYFNVGPIQAEPGVAPRNAQVRLCCDSAATQPRHSYDSAATQLRLCCDTATTLLRLCCDTATTLLQLCCGSAATQLRLCCDTTATLLRHIYDSAATQLRLCCDTAATVLRHSCDSAATQL